MTPKYALILFILICCTFSMQAQNKTALVIHGGAGTITRENMTPELEKQYRDKMEEALKAGHTVLKNGGSSTDAVIATIQVMEKSPLFNAGKGAVFTHEGRNEMDASIMEGKNRNAGAVAGITNIKSPILAARMVMENSPHVMLSGQGAETFAREQGLETADPSYFYTERRYQQLQRIKDSNEQELDHDGANKDKRQGSLNEKFPYRKFGTVGCIALDKDGNITAGTSTGGMTNKQYGRIGDSPVIGSGTYANNATCGVSATGHGEYFIRSVVGYDIAALMEYKGMSVQEAANEVVNNKLVKMQGSGGVVAMDAEGNVAMPFNTPGMYRGYINPDGDLFIGIYKDESR
jgi:L-asparaginase / beta-aspartyl-peptidase